MKLDRYVGTDRGVGLVPNDLEIVDTIVVNARGPAKEVHLRKGPRFALQLKGCLFTMVQIDVDVAAHPDEFAELEIALLRKHRLECRELLAAALSVTMASTESNPQSGNTDSRPSLVWSKQKITFFAALIIAR